MINNSKEYKKLKTDQVEKCPSDVQLGKVQNMDPWSRDPLRGPSPWNPIFPTPKNTGKYKTWTPGPWTGDRVHGLGPLTPHFSYP